MEMKTKVKTFVVGLAGESDHQLNVFIGSFDLLDKKIREELGVNIEIVSVQDTILPRIYEWRENQGHHCTKQFEAISRTVVYKEK